MITVKGILILTMFLAGGLAAAQGALNTQLSNFIGSPFQASFISFCIGALVLGIYLVVSKQNLPSFPVLRQIPPYYLLGGLCGSVFITCMIFLIPRIGVVNVLFLGLAGQMIVSVAIDSFGLFGLKPQQLSLVKAAGVLIILIGVGLLNYEARKVTTTLDSSIISDSAINQTENKFGGINESVKPDSAGLVPLRDSMKTSKLSHRREQLALRQNHKRAARLLVARRNSAHVT